MCPILCFFKTNLVFFILKENKVLIHQLIEIYIKIIKIFYLNAFLFKVDNGYIVFTTKLKFKMMHNLKN